jgi:hypothetical protein
MGKGGRYEEKGRNLGFGWGVGVLSDSRPQGSLWVVREMEAGGT